LLCLGLLACRRTVEDTSAAAYVAPATVNLRSDLSQKNATVAVLKHGERVRIEDIRRRFIKVRTSAGAQGWLDAATLLTPEAMAKLQRDRAHALQLPSEGAAGVYEALNIHLEPSRQSPAFTQIPEGQSVEVLAQQLVPKTTGPARAPVFAIQRAIAIAAQQRPRREKKPRNTIKLPAAPPPPKPPADWLALSGHPELNPDGTSKAPAPATPAEPEKPAVLESWTLVRTSTHETGWVLSRNLVMLIPDEVAQYAEGRRITSYFDLGEVPDEEKGPKHNWLWTTVSEQVHFDFDSWRVFLWNRRRHRYETSYRQRDVEGYFPVHVDKADASTNLRTFQLILKTDTGQVLRNTYSFDGTRVRLTSTEPYDLNSPAKPQPEEAISDKPKAAQPSWIRDKLNRLKQRLSSRNK
jgi:hypothetical protein